MTKLISIVVPMYNEAENVDALIAAISDLSRKISERWGFSVEVIINDNASTDQTFERIRVAQASAAPLPLTLRVFRFSRNIGFQRSILVGYRKSKGDAVVQMDADLQDPPSLVLDFIQKWTEGYYVVYGVRRQRREGPMITGLRKLFYRILDRISIDDLPYDSGDFRLVDRRLVDVICEMQDQDPYLRGLIATLGTRQVGIPYDRDARQRGRSKFGLADLVRLSLDAVTNHSVVPLRLASYVAFGVMALVCVLIALYFGAWVIHGHSLPAGFTTQLLVQLFGIAILAGLIGLQGEYISRIYKQVKERPLAVIETAAEREQSGSEGSEQIEVLWFGTGNKK